MTIEEIREELQNKIHELEWRNNVRSLELINWMQEILKKTEVKETPAPKKIEVVIPEEEYVTDEPLEISRAVKEKKSAPKRKITFKKK